MTKRQSAAEKAGAKAADRTPEEQKEVLADAPEPTDKQQEELDEAAGAAQPPVQDDSAGTDADSEDPAKKPELDEDSDIDEPEAAPVVEGVSATVVRHADQRVGVVSASALNVHNALELKPSTEWTENLSKAIEAFQKTLGQKETGYLTRDQCRRLGLTLLG